jgi:hypothetical protein
VRQNNCMKASKQEEAQDELLRPGNHHVGGSQVLLERAHKWNSVNKCEGTEEGEMGTEQVRARKSGRERGGGRGQRASGTWNVLGVTRGTGWE